MAHQTRQRDNVRPGDLFGQPVVIVGKPAEAGRPGEGARDHPAPGQHHDPALGRGQLHHRPRGHLAGGALVNVRQCDCGLGGLLLRQALARKGRKFTAADVDWLLWNQGQSLPETTEPYHRTRTIYY